MKKTALLLGLFSMMAIVSCKKNEDVTPPPAPMETPAPDPEIPTTTPPPAPEVPANSDEANGTSVSVGKDGIDVNTKNNTKGVASFVYYNILNEE